MHKTESSAFNTLTQFFLPAFTILGFTLTALKYPGYGLAVNLAAQVFWLYAGYRAWKRAGQIGLFITAVVITVVLAYGVLNYFVF